LGWSGWGIGKSATDPDMIGGVRGLLKERWKKKLRTMGVEDENIRWLVDSEAVLNQSYFQCSNNSFREFKHCTLVSDRYNKDIPFCFKWQNTSKKWKKRINN
jgi:hypothetical protein